MHTYQLEGLEIKTGDILCTTTGDEDLLIGEFWRLLGRLVPGEVDHVAVYVGPGGRIVEAGGTGVIAFDLNGHRWTPEEMRKPRGGLLDRFLGVAYPLNGRGLSPEEDRRIRQSVANYCLAQAAAHKPYNLNFLNPDTEGAFYCSQLAYKAYLQHGINLNTGQGVPNLPGTDRIVFPQEIWSGCVHVRTPDRVKPSPTETAALEQLVATVDEFMTFITSLPGELLAESEWGPKEVLAHLVYHHELYIRLIRGILQGNPEQPPTGRFRDLNALAVRASRGLPCENLLSRLRLANDEFIGLYQDSDPGGLLIEIKAGAKPRTLEKLVPEIEAHIRNHLIKLRGESHRTGLTTSPHPGSRRANSP